MILKDTAIFEVQFIVSLSGLRTSLLWRSTVAFTYLKVKSIKDLFTSGGLGLGRVLLHGLGLGLKNLVLFTSLRHNARFFTILRL